MSFTTDVIIACSPAEPKEGDSHQALAAINRYLLAQCNATLRCVSKYAGGRHRPYCLVYQGTFNYLTEEDFISVVDQAPWSSKGTVQVFLKTKVENLFSMFRFHPNHPPTKIQPSPENVPPKV